MKKADAILCGDIHLREDVPICRTDDFQKAQREKMLFICDLQQRHDCPVFCSGDLFDKAKPSLEFYCEVLDMIPKNFFTVYGNHDLPNHNLLEQKKCGSYALAKAKKLNILTCCHFGQEPMKEQKVSSIAIEDFHSIKIGNRRILVWHTMTYKIDPPYPGCEDLKARSLLHKYPQYDLILTGDNHEPFTQEYKGRLLVNPGSMMRQDADQINYKPAVWLYYAKTNTVEPVYLPIEKDAVTREHIEKIEQSNERILAFISTLNKKGMDSISFKKNMKIFLRKNKIEKSVEDIIYEMMEETK